MSLEVQIITRGKLPDRLNGNGKFMEFSATIRKVEGRGETERVLKEASGPTYLSYGGKVTALAILEKNGSYTIGFYQKS